MENSDTNTAKYNLTSKENFAETDVNEKASCLKWRYIMAFVCFMAMFNSFWISGILSVAIVSMTHPPEGGARNHFAHANDDNGSRLMDADAFRPLVAEFDWDPEIQGILLGGYFWGLLVMQAASGILVDRYGSKRVVAIGGALTALGSLLAPVAATTHVYFFIATRVLSGLGASVFSPSLVTIIAGWFHPHERSRFLSFIFSGCLLGIASSFILTGYLCNMYPYEGWKWSFYSAGTSMAAWLFLWVFLVKGTPRENPWISDKERLYIESGISGGFRKSEKRVIPWMSMCKSIPLWAIMINAFGQGWGFYTLLTQMPMYMKTILGFDISQSGIYASLPYIVNVIVGYGSSFLSDYLIRSKTLGVLNVRRVFSLIGIVPCGICMIAVTFVDNDSFTVYILLVIGLAMFGFMHSGSNINQIDLAPNYVGILQGIISSAMSITGVLAPYAAGVILEGEASVAQWNVVFYVSAGMLIGCVIVYCILADSQLQPWNSTPIPSSPLPIPETEANVTIAVVNVENGVILTSTPDGTCDVIKRPQLTQ